MKKYSKYFIALALVMLVVLGVLVSCDDTIKTAKGEFWEELETAVQEEVKTVAAVTINKTKEDITVVFKDTVTSSQVKAAAEALFGKIKDVIDSGELTLGSKKFDIDDSDVVVEVAKHLLGDQEASEFLDDGVKVTSNYSAKVKYKGVEFTLKGKLTFDVAD